MLEDHLWVEVEVNKGIGAVSSYRGHIARRALDKWCTGPAEGAFALEDTYWWTRDPQLDGGGFYTVMGRTRESSYANATGRVFLRYDLVVTIIELGSGDEYEEALRRTGALHAGGSSGSSSH